MVTKGKHEGGRGRGAKTDLINFDHRNDAQPLKQEVAVKKTGGLFLSPNGVKVEIPPGAASGRKERLLCATVPSSARGIVAPWLGPNLRMASDIQLFYSPQNFRNPIALFIPFTCAAARELAYPVEGEESDLFDTKKFKVETTMKESNDGDSVVQTAEVIYGRLSKTPSKQKSTPVLHLGKKTTKEPALLDTRSVFLLSCKLGDDRWDIIENFTVIQPTVHYNQWPVELKRLAVQSTRWHETGAQSNTTADASKRLSGLAQRNRRTGGTLGRDADPLDHIRRMETYCGGICIATEELCHSYMIVIGTKAENFIVNPEGGFLRAPLLHPFLSVRIPKRACMLNKIASFKAIEIRPNWNQLVAQFDSQMMEVEGCSDIYELDLSDVLLRRPAVVRIPLPNWFMERKSRSHENLDQNSITLCSSDPQDPSSAYRFGISDGTYCYERPLMLLYQPPGSKRQIVWQPATVDDAREDLGRRKSRFQVARKDTMSSDRCKIENLYIRLGWSFLMVGLRGGQWFTVKQPLYFTKRTAFFQTSMLGRFVLIGARDPERTPVTKLAHLMTRVEALSVAPPGALVIFLQLQPNCWKIMAKLYPEDRLAENIQEQVAAGFIPIVQFGTGPVRRTLSLCNALIQATDIIQMFREVADTQKIRKTPPIRVNGVDINHVLMYNGLTLEFRLTGDIRQKPVNQFEPMCQAIRNTKPTEAEAEATRPISRETNSRPNISLSLMGEKPEAAKPRDYQQLLTSTAYLQHHELMTETACCFEIEPILEDESKFDKKSFDKQQLITDGLRSLMKKRENASDDDDEEEDDEDDGGVESEEEGFRRSFSSENQIPVAYDGNDGEVDEFTQEAQEQVLRNQPLSVTTINSELLRRVNNVMEKSRVSKAGEFIQKVHDIFHVGTLEVWLATPQVLPQLAAPKTKKMKIKSSDSTVSSQGPSEHFSQSTEKGVSLDGMESGAIAQKTSDVENEESPGEEDDDEDVQESHNAIRWNPVESTTIEAKQDMMANPAKPLAVYDILIDPDLVLSYNRVPTSKPTGPPVVQKKGGRSKSPKKNRSKSTGKNNANMLAENNSSWADSTAVAEMPQLNEETLKTVAKFVSNPEKLAMALNLSSMEYEQIGNAKPAQSMADVALEVLQRWLRSKESTTTTLPELSDALKALGCYQAVELLNRR